MEELFDLMAADVAKDAAVFRALEKPCRARFRVEPVRTGAERLEDAADGAVFDQAPGMHRTFGMQPLVVVDRVAASCFEHRTPSRAPKSAALSVLPPTCPALAFSIRLAATL